MHGQMGVRVETAKAVRGGVREGEREGGEGGRTVCR